MNKTMQKIFTLIFALVTLGALGIGALGLSSCTPATTSGSSSSASASVTASSSSAASSSAASTSNGSSNTTSTSSTSSGSSTASSSSSAGSQTAAQSSSSSLSPPADVSVEENGEYSSKDEVALYIHLYGHLPSNYISKSKARKAGWNSSKGNLWDVLPGKSIGGSEFYNDEGQLPDQKGRRWTECDIDYDGGFRNAKRIVFSNDGLVYYTGDHYKTFERLY